MVSIYTAHMIRILVILLTLMTFSPGQSLAMGEGAQQSVHGTMNMADMGHDCCQEEMADCDGNCDMGCHQAPVSILVLGAELAAFKEAPPARALASPLNPGPDPLLRPPRA